MVKTMQEVINPGASQHDTEFPYAPNEWSREIAIFSFHTYIAGCTHGSYAVAPLGLVRQLLRV
jgi:hypothetical protein